ncbi:MAG: CopD family protein [Granulosicoccaceae bacterium]|jgi:uncharacterized membrane protein
MSIDPRSLFVALHLLSAVIWVGGMFFAYLALRPVAASQLEPPARLKLWDGVFCNFFPWVWISVILLLATGYLLGFKNFGGFAGFPMYVNLMQGLGILMMLIFGHVVFALFMPMKKAIAAEDWAKAGAKLAKIRVLIGVNLALGLLVVAIAAGGRYL